MTPQRDQVVNAFENVAPARYVRKRVAARALQQQDPTPADRVWPSEIYGDWGWPNDWDESAAVAAYTSTVYVAADAIADRVARLAKSNRLAIHRPNGRDQQLREHPILQVLRNPTPLPSLTGSALIKLTSLWLDLTGNAYWLKIRDASGAIRGLWPLFPHLTRVVTSDASFVTGVNYYPDGFRADAGRELGFPIRDIIHFRLANPRDHVYGYSTLRAAAYEKNVSDAIRIYESNWFKNQARPDYVIAAGIEPGPDAASDLERLWARIRIHHQGAKRFGLPLLLPKGSDVKHIQFSLADMQFLQLAEMTEDQILRIFKVPRFAVGKDQNFSTRAAATAAAREFAENAIAPRADLIWDTINNALINNPEDIPRPMGVRLELVHDSAAPKDEELALDRAVRGFKTWLITRDEAREELGWGPAKVGGDEYAPVVQSAITPKPSQPLTQTDPDPSEPSQQGKKPDPNAKPNAAKSADDEIRDEIRRVAAVVDGLAKSIETMVLPKSTSPAQRRHGTVVPVDLSTKEARESYWDQMIAPQDAAVSRGAVVVRSYLRKQRERILPQVRSYVESMVGKYAGWHPAKVQKQLAEWVRKGDKRGDPIDREAEAVLLAGAILALIRRDFKDGAAQMGRRVGTVLDESSPEVVAWIRSHAGEQAAAVTDTTVRRVADIVREGLTRGASSDAIVSAVSDEFDVWTASEARSDLIARTITSTSYGYAHLRVLEQAQAEGKVDWKVWVTRKDERVRTGRTPSGVTVGASHRIDGEAVPVSSRFSNGMLGPGDTSTGNPADFMGERCVLGYA